jgi:hypothetical protein
VENLLYMREAEPANPGRPFRTWTWVFCAMG